MLQILRRCIQVSVVMLVAMIAVLSLYAHYRSARVIDDEQLMAGLQCEDVTTFIHPYVDKLDDPQSFLDGFKGTVWSMQLAGVDIADPLAPLEMIATSKRVYWPLMASAMIPPICWSWLAAHVPTWDISSDDLTSLLIFSRLVTTASIALSMPRFISLGLPPAVMFLSPSV